MKPSKFKKLWLLAAATYVMSASALLQARTVTIKNSHATPIVKVTYKTHGSNAALPPISIPNGTLGAGQSMAITKFPDTGTIYLMAWYQGVQPVKVKTITAGTTDITVNFSGPDQTHQVTITTP